MFQKELVIKARGIGGGEWLEAFENGSSICSISINTEWRGALAQRKSCLCDRSVMDSNLEIVSLHKLE